MQPVITRSCSVGWLLCKRFAEPLLMMQAFCHDWVQAQDELQQLQAQLVAAKRVTAASAATAVDLKLQLQQVQQQNTQLHENLQAAADAQQQLTILQQQLDLAKQQLGAAKEVSTAKQHQAQELQQQLEVQEQLHKQQEQAAAEQLASAKGHIAAGELLQGTGIYTFSCGQLQATYLFSSCTWLHHCYAACGAAVTPSCQGQQQLLQAHTQGLFV